MKPRLTTNRKAVLEILQKKKDLLSAADMHKLLPELDLVTIYRSLEYLTKVGLIKKIRLGDSQEARFEYQDSPHHHAVCTECDKVIHFTASDDKIKKLLGINDFEVGEVEITVKGVCK